MSAAIHLAFDEFEPGDLALGLAVGPFRSHGLPDGGFILGDAVGEGRQKAFFSSAPASLPVLLVRQNQVVFLRHCVQIGSQTVPWADFIRHAYMARVQLSATGFYKTPKIHWDRKAGRGNPFYYFAGGAAVSEVTIDTLTGEYRVELVDVLHDVGHSLNPAIDLGQIEGDFVQGMGWLTTEELWWDGTGCLRTHAPSAYKIPVASDRPRIFNIALLDDAANARPTIHRSKAVGEPPLMLAISVLHALSDALASVANYRVCPQLDTPASPERVLAAVERLRAAQA